MKILLLGEYSNVHWTLAEGLRELGHHVTVISDGDHWKGYQRDISLRRPSLGAWGTVRYLASVAAHLKDMRGYDVVQLINPVFLDLKAERIYPFYRFVRRNNGHLFLGAFGMDYYWVKAGLDCHTFRYSDFNLGREIRHSADNDTWIADWLNGAKGQLNRYVADDCDGIISGLYEYDASYRPYFADKLRFIPFPINRAGVQLIDRPQLHGEVPPRIRFFIGIQRLRSAYKGTDIMLHALNRVAAEFPQRCEMVKVESVPFAEYQNLMNHSDLLLDQLYSYTPSMNSLLGMAKGLVLVGGGEPENYDILGEHELRPIINVLPSEEDVYQKLRAVVEHPDCLPTLSRQSLEYIARHHDHVKVAQQYVDFWHSCGV